VAFVWDGEQGDNLDTYVKMVGRSEVRRLTSDPLADSAPSWSPDGRHVAFVREIPGTTPTVDRTAAPIGRIHLASPLGGSDLKLSEFRVAAPLAWTPDGRYLAAQHTPESGDARPGGVYLVPVDGGEPRALTTVTSGTRHVAPAFSRDGRRLAYGSCVGHGCEIYVVGLRDGIVPSGPARQLTDELLFEVGSIAWTGDGRSLVFGSAVAAFVSYLWRLDVDARSTPERIELAGIGAATPATALANDQLALLAFGTTWTSIDSSAAALPRRSWRPRSPRPNLATLQMAAASRSLRRGPAAGAKSGSPRPMGPIRGS